MTTIEEVKKYLPFNNSVGNIVRYSGAPPRVEQRPRGIFTDDDPNIVASYNPSFTEVYDSVSSDSSLSNNNDWDGGGGGFDGGGASGDW